MNKRIVRAIVLFCLIFFLLFGLSYVFNIGIEPVRLVVSLSCALVLAFSSLFWIEKRK